MPTSLAILGSSFSGEAKGRAVGTWAAAGAIAGAIGPVVGGWAIDAAGWRSIFLLNLPLALGSIALAGAFVHDADGEKHAALDLSGAFLATASLGALTWGLTLGTGPQGWSADAVVSLATGSFLLLAFLWVENRKGDRAMMPLALFASRSFVGITLLTLMLYGALAGLLVLIPYVLIREAGYSGLAAGAALLPFPLVLATTSPVIGALSGRIGARIPLIAGPLVVAAGFLLATRIGSGSSYWTTFLPAVLVIALGMAGAVAPLTMAVLTSVDAQHAGSASGFNSAVARTGGLVATALLGSVLAASGPELIADFRVAVAVCSVASLAAAISAYALIAN
jgi:MFS family permease